MRKFSFRLEPVLRLRISQENMLIAQLAELRRRQEAEEALLARRIGEFGRAVEAARESRAQLISSPQAEVASQRYLGALDDAIRAQRHCVETACKAVAAKLAEVTEAASRRKTLENLRERHLAAYTEQSKAEDIRTLDDFASLAAARKPGQR